MIICDKSKLDVLSTNQYPGVKLDRWVRWHANCYSPEQTLSPNFY